VGRYILQNDIKQAVKILQQGGLVAFPTETVYGLGADAKNPAALAKIFQAKGRPMDHPLIVHLANQSQLTEWAREIPSVAYALIEAFWPGPLTLIFKKAAHVLDMITGGQDTVGIRMPSHPLAKILLESFGSGLAAPSANRFGRISPTTADAVREELGAAVDLVLDGGQCVVGVESTIIDVSAETPVILRPGMLTRAEIEVVLQQSVLTNQKNSPRVSGSHDSHYAPKTKTVLVDTKTIPQFLAAISPEQLPMAFVLVKTKFLPREGVDCVSMSTDPKDYAHDLYATLRELDKKNYQQIVIESVPVSDEWDAIRDRLGRATQPS
jgi:L-threonylcarbamoyladenylate synthase